MFEIGSVPKALRIAESQFDGLADRISAKLIGPSAYDGVLPGPHHAARIAAAADMMVISRTTLMR